MATRKINEFYQKIKTGGVRKTHEWQMTITGTGITQVDSALADITMYARSADKPGVTINTADVKYLSFPFFVETNVNMTREMTFQMFTSTNMVEHDALLLLMQTTVDFDIDGGSVMGGNKRPKDAVIRLDLLAEDMETIVATYELYGASCTNVGTSQLSNENANVLTFPVKFQYQYWRLINSPNL